MTVLLIDANYIAWRAFHTTGKNLDRGTTYGFLSTLQKLRDQFQPDRIAFCFDGDGPSKRKDIYLDYKGNRGADRHPWDDDVDERKKVRDEIDELKNTHLFALGWKNVFHANGFEADDVIASLVRSNCEICDGDGLATPAPECRPCRRCNGSGMGNGSSVIVSADHDLYQLLGDNVKMWEPSKKRLLDAKQFRDEWGISPTKWVNVKAIAGCSSDNIPGIRGIGEKTAAKYLVWHQNYLKDSSKFPIKKWVEKVRDKMQANSDLIKFNLRLVGLPFEGCPQFKMRADEATGGKWLRWCEANQMKSLLRRNRLERQS